jgi:hypothetical protein
MYAKTFQITESYLAYRFFPDQRFGPTESYETSKNVCFRGIPHKQVKQCEMT